MSFQTHQLFQLQLPFHHHSKFQRLDDRNSNRLECRTVSTYKARTKKPTGISVCRAAEARGSESWRREDL
ncbi:hypothetical protein LINGRAHAP2_LOCUS35645 [Linum grandiflorum]